MERNLRQIRNAGFPASPKTADEIIQAFAMENVMESFGFTKCDENLPFYKTTIKTDSFSFCVFSSNGVIEKIKSNIAPERREILMDATFKICPFGEFKQLLIIYIGYMDEVLLKFYRLHLF